MRKPYQHPAPQLSFHNAMERVLTLAPGKTTTVRECSEEAFTAMLQEVLHRSADEEAITLELQGLCYENAVDRWFCLNVLLKHGIAVS